MHVLTAVQKANNLLAMWRNQWTTRPHLSALQERKLHKLIQHACKNFPYYTALFREAGIDPFSVRSIADLASLPTSTKSQLREALTPKRSPRTVTVRTSGSTGLPWDIVYTRNDVSIANISWLRPQLAHGFFPWQRRFEISGPHNLDKPKHWYQHIGLFRQEGVSIFKEPSVWLAEIRQRKREVLWGYSGSLKILARSVLDHGGIDYRPRLVFGVSDLVDDELRELVFTAFGTKLIDLYGAAETGCLAWQCPVCSGYHLNCDNVITEFLLGHEPAPAGTTGRIVVTNLHSFAMPLIRYELGDMGVISAAEPVCGRSLPLMQLIGGRADDEIVLPIGLRLSPMFFFSLMKKARGLRAWQIVQNDWGRLTVLVVPEKASDTNLLQTVRDVVTSEIGPDMALEVRGVDEIRPDPSGKRRAVVSTLSINARQGPRRGHV